LEPLAYIHRDKLYYSDEAMSELGESAELYDNCAKSNSIAYTKTS